MKELVDASRSQIASSTFRHVQAKNHNQVDENDSNYHQPLLPYHSDVIEKLLKSRIASEHSRSKR